MKKIILILIITLSFNNSLGQIFHRKNNQDRLVILSPGFSTQGNGNYYTEINFMYAKLESGGPCTPPALYGPRIGLETNFNNNHLVYAPKIGWEGSSFLFGIRGSIISYIDQGQIDLRFLPEIGISLLSGVNLFYGYNIPLRDFRTTATTKHRLTLTINLDFDLWSDF